MDAVEEVGWHAITASIEQIKETVTKGRSPDVVALVNEALTESLPVSAILNDGYSTDAASAAELATRLVQK